MNIREEFRCDLKLTDENEEQTQSKGQRGKNQCTYHLEIQLAYNSQFQQGKTTAKKNNRLNIHLQLGRDGRQLRIN